MQNVGEEWGALREFRNNFEGLGFEVEPDLMLTLILLCEVTKSCSYHGTAETTTLQFFMPSEDKSLLYTYISLLVLGEQTTCFFSSKQFNLCLSHSLSSKGDHNQLHTQATKKYFIQFHILMFSADLS